MPRPQLSARIKEVLASPIDYSAFQSGNGQDNYRVVLSRILESIKVSNYGDFINYLNKNGGLEQRTFPSRKYNVPSSLLGIHYFGPDRARVVLQHLKVKGLLKLLKQEPKTSKKPNPPNKI